MSPVHSPLPYRTKWSAFRRTVAPPYVHPKYPRDPNEKLPYYMKAPARSKYMDALDYIETRGMYREELNIERGTYPVYHEMWCIGTDGSMTRVDVEYPSPHFVVLYRDRLSVYREAQEMEIKAQRLRVRRSWEIAERAVAAQEEGTSEDPSLENVPRCNMLEFPYCVPTTGPRRGTVASGSKFENRLED